MEYKYSKHRNAAYCRRCGRTEGVIYSGHFCKACLPAKEQLYQLYVIERKSKRQILDIVNAGYSRNLSNTKLKSLAREYGITEINKKIYPSYENRSDKYDKRYCFSRHHGERSINKQESKIKDLSKNLIYVGGVKKGFKRIAIKTSPKLEAYRVKTKRLRYPDFIVINDERYLESLQNLSNWYEIQDKVARDFRNKNFIFDKVVEFNGYYWHQKNFNGRTKEEYEKDEIEDYKKANVNCLTIWDNELKDIQAVKSKINEFVKS